MTQPPAPERRSSARRTSSRRSTSAESGRSRSQTATRRPGARSRRAQIQARRSLAIASALAIAASSYFLFIRDGGEEEALPNSYEDSNSGLSVRWPDGWNKEERSGAIALQSPDKAVVTTLRSVAVGAEIEQREELLQEALDEIGAAHGVEAWDQAPGEGAGFAGLPGRVFLGRGKTEEGVPEAILLHAGWRGKLTYLVVTFFAENASRESSEQSGEIITSIRVVR